MNKIICGNSLEVLLKATPNSIDSIVTDPPYGLSFMGKKWDYDVPSKEIWEQCLRVLKPGGYLLAFAGTRTQHRMAVNIEDAGFEIRDMIAWVYGSGFPKSRNIGKDIEKKEVGGIKNLKQIGTKPGIKVETGTQGFSYSKEYVAGKSMGGKQISGEIPVYEINNEWEGWGTALKPALEPITVARKPLSEKTVAENVLKWGTGGINIDESRVESTGESLSGGMINGTSKAGKGWDRPWRSNPEIIERNKIEQAEKIAKAEMQGRFPANLIHDGSDEVVSLFPDSKSSNAIRHNNGKQDDTTYGKYGAVDTTGYDDSGSAARFFKQCELTEEDIWEQENNDQTVKSATNQSGLCETPTAQEVVRTQSLDSKTETLPVSQDSISNSNDSTQHQSLVQTAEGKQSTDTTQTTQNSLKSSGSAHPVIDVPINQVNPNSDNAPKRFLYQPKASKADRDEGLESFEDKQSGSFDGNADLVNTNRKIGEHPDKPNAPRKNHHPTVKPTKLMQYLVKLVTPKGGVVLDPFMGSGSTGKACKLEGFDFIGIELDPEYCKIAEARINAI